MYGGLGWLIGKYFGHQQAFMAVGILLGIFLALYLTYARVSMMNRDTTTSDRRNP
jgi:F0F1-type ATP synthase assembly protein I